MPLLPFHAFDYFRCVLIFAFSQRVEIKLDKKITHGTISIVQDYFVAKEKEYTLPPNSASGPVFAVEAPVAASPTPKPNNLSEGDAPVELRQLVDAYPEQCSSF